MSRVYGTCDTCGGSITKRQHDERHADEVWCGTCGIRFSLSNPGLAARTVDGTKTWTWTPAAQSEEEKRERDWVDHMADLEEEHGGFSGFTGGVGALKKKIKFILNGVECYLTFADAEHGTPQGWAKPEHVEAAGYVLKEEVTEAEIRSAKDLIYKIRQNVCGMILESGNNAARLRALLRELDDDVRSMEKKLARAGESPE